MSSGKVTIPLERPSGVDDRHGTDHYIPPATGIFAVLPRSWVPYAELMRLYPVGFAIVGLFWAMGLSFAATITQPLIPFKDWVSVAGPLYLWLFVTRCFLIAFNDAVDCGFDRQVSRTRFRPVARGAITPDEAFLFSAAGILFSTVLLRLTPVESHWWALITTLIMLVYPFCKRFTYFPQVVMGFGYGASVFQCCTALGVDVFGYESEYRLSTLCLAGVEIIIPVIMDVIYAQQDIRDDARIGAKSLTILMGEQVKLYLWALGLLLEALLVTIGVENDYSSFYFMISCGGSFLVLSTTLLVVDVRVAQSCFTWFIRFVLFTTGMISSGFMVEYALRLWLFSH
jgi:4-hydroxybenzoate polyprenyltransferase